MRYNKTIVDGYCILPEQIKNDPNIIVVKSGHEPKSVKIRKRTMLDKGLGRRRTVLSAPSPERFKNALDKTGADMVFVLTVVDKLSPAYSNTRIAKGMFIEENPGRKVRIVNTNTYGYGEGMAVKRLISLCSSGKKFGEISAYLNNYLSNLFPVFTSSYAGL